MLDIRSCVYKVDKLIVKSKKFQYCPQFHYKFKDNLGSNYVFFFKLLDQCCSNSEMRTMLIMWLGSTYRAFISMDMTSKHNINLVLNKPGLKHNSHGLPFHVMVCVTIVPWRMHKNNQPWCFSSINF